MTAYCLNKLNENLITVGLVSQTESVIEVKRPSPKIRSVGAINEPVTSRYESGSVAEVLAMPDGKLVRIPITDSHKYEYDKITALPKDHPIAVALQNDPNTFPEIMAEDEGSIGSLVSEKEATWIKQSLEAAIKSYYRDQNNTSLTL